MTAIARILSTMLLVTLAATPATATTLLIEGKLDGKILRILVDTEEAKAEVTLGQGHHRVDLDAVKAQIVHTDGTLADQELAEQNGTMPVPQIKPWGPGPMIAGHASVYHVITLGDQICGELLISPWMKPFVTPAVEALAILERIKGDHDIKDATLDGPCGALPFTSYAAAGWPLMAGGMNHHIFKTETISFDYDPSGDELTWNGL